MGVQLTDVFDALQSDVGSYYVNDFNRFGRTWQVNIQADAPFRTDAADIQQIKVRNADGDMVPLGRSQRCATRPARRRSSGTTCSPLPRLTAHRCGHEQRRCHQDDRGSRTA